MRLAITRSWIRVSKLLITSPSSVSHFIYWSDTFFSRTDLHHLAVYSTSLGTVLPNLFQERPVGAQIQDRILIAPIDVSAPQKIRHDENVVLFPLETLPANLSRAGPFEHGVKRIGGLPASTTSPHPVATIAPYSRGLGIPMPQSLDSRSAM